jgi:4-amino-4-deoxy-L-arabinose transferase-like glycosyltransferase
LPVRLVQAALGAGCIALVYLVVRRTRRGLPQIARRGWTVPLAAAAVAAIEPYTIGISAVLLSEALFLPWMLLSLWGLAVLWPGAAEADCQLLDQQPATGFSTAREWAVALSTGAAFGAGICTKPSWALFPPVSVLAWIATSGRDGRRAAVARAALLLLGATAVMAPWWLRNASVFGRFVPTALWAGASLYDGLGPQSTGASDMAFLNAPELQPLSEEDQDAILLRRSWEAVRSDPARVARLALIKAVRYWSPWPNAETRGSLWVWLLCAMWTMPLYGLLAAGAWHCRRDVRALTLLAGPLLYFAALHVVFVSSIRYRIPGMVPALGLVAVGLDRIVPWVRRTT